MGVCLGFLANFLSSVRKSAPLRKITSVATAKPKSLTPRSLKPREKAMPNRCNERMSEEKRV